MLQNRRPSFRTARTSMEMMTEFIAVVRALAGRLALIVAVGAGCSQPASPTVDTGLAGEVVRGPITPVCAIGTPCDAPFSSSFDVFQDSRHVAGFKSDSGGHFTVMLAAGTYRIIPAVDAPILQPSAQIKTVEVLPVGLTPVRLEFDTGIR